MLSYIKRKSQGTARLQQCGMSLCLRLMHSTYVSFHKLRLAPRLASCCPWQSSTGLSKVLGAPATTGLRSPLLSLGPSNGSLLPPMASSGLSSGTPGLPLGARPQLLSTVPSRLQNQCCPGDSYIPTKFSRQHGS